MKIKDIRLYGFKSFNDETKVSLNSGIIAFVGPNGAGKSNVFDALRWVLGEQSMKALRCERIEDLIYVSPDKRENAAFTEVALIIENEDYFPQFGSEFEIKRRFYRNGESEFYLNRVRCRLQDIQALFLNSGAVTYSFLELSEIERIIEGDTKEMFDDVSGVLRYQQRREQTKRRLEATEQDLLRLEDLIAEMQRGLRSLRRQVRQAQLYHDLRDEYKSLTLFIMKNEYNRTSEEIAKIQQQIKTQEQMRQSHLQEIGKLEKVRKDLKAKMREFETKRSASLAQIENLNSEIDNLEKERGKKEEEVKRVTLFNERTITSIKEKETMLDNNKKRLREIEDKKTNLQNEIEEINTAIKEASSQLDSKNEVYFSLVAQQKDKEKIITELSNKIKSNNIQISKLKFERENKESIRLRISGDITSQREEMGARGKIKKELEGKLNSSITEQKEADTKLGELNKRLQDLEKSRLKRETDLQQREEAINTCRAVIDSLSHRLSERDRAKEIKAKFANKFLGLFREKLKVNPGYESIVDICLGDLLNFYLLKDFERRDFMELPEGRFGFVNTQAIVEKKNPPEILKEVSPISHFIEFKSQKGPFERYINNYFLIEDFNKANEFSLKFPEYGFVTPDCILFKDGTITTLNGEVGYFRLKKSLKEYTKKLETLQNERVFTLNEVNRLDGEIATTKKSIEHERDRLLSINIKKSQYSLQLREIEKAIEAMGNVYGRLTREKKSLSKSSSLLLAQIKELEEENISLTEKIEENEKEKAGILEDMNGIKKEITEKKSVLNGQSLKLAVLSERTDSIKGAYQQLNQEIQTLSQEIAELKNNTTVETIKELNDMIKSLHIQHQSKIEEKKLIESKLPEKMLEEFTQKQNGVFDQLTQHQKVNEDIQNDIMQLNYQLFQYKNKRDEAKNNAKEEFGVEIVDYIPDDIVDAASRLTFVKEKLQKLGEVNLLSLQAYEDEKRRLGEFLRQRDDIITAKRSLLKSIGELDQRARARFTDVFSQVKQEFNSVFSHFFEGGEADLVLTNPENPLTSQVEIVVRMQGKKLKRINQLSGGERTLLAISLLFAFFLVKPAPFCILDEIDAPLDDANVIRFNRYLKNLSKRTQIIIITHNRATMEYADYLYGITMETPGKSKVVSARLEDLKV